jgi:hypothetical protein
MLRLTGLLLALSGVLVAPGLAVAHGLAHHYAMSEHHELSSAQIADDHGHESADHTTGATDFASIAVGQSGGHAHLDVDAALASKSSVHPVALLAPALAVPSASTRETMPVRCRVTVERRANLAHAPPPRLRSPPANA